MSGYLAIVQHVLEGGLVRALVSKPVRQAIGRLVSGTADVGNAYLESWAQRKRSDTLAEKQITSAIAGKAKELVEADPDLAQRGLDRWSRKLGSRQRSVDEVAIRAIGILGEEDIPTDAAAPSEDFMRMFEDMAERATTEEVADLLARVLAGEIRKPGSVSRRVLQVVAALDQDLVHSIGYLRPRILRPSWTFVPDGDGVFEKWSDLAESVSLIKVPEAIWIKPDEKLEMRFQLGSRTLITTSQYDNNIQIKTIQLTPTGREVLALFPDSYEDKIMDLALGLRLFLFVTGVEVCDLEIEEGEPREINRRRLL